MKFKTIVFLFILGLASIPGFTQEAFKINVFVDADKNIYLEDEEVAMNQLSRKTRTLIYNQPALKYDRLIFNIYGDQDLKHGFIMDVNHKLITAAKGLKSRTNKYLLAYKNINIEDTDWQEEVKSLKLDAIKD